MEKWEALTITLGALAANMRDVVKELDKTVGPVEVDYVSASNTTAMVKLKHGFDEFAEKTGAKVVDYKWARFVETPFGDFYEEKTKEEREAYVDPETVRDPE